MILADLTNPEEFTCMVAVQKSSNAYVYTHWDSISKFHMSSYHTQIAGNYDGIIGIGPTILVEW